jgi:arylsulfatase A-like enzyme
MSGPLQLVDLGPTLLSLLGISDPAFAAPGRGFAALLRGEAEVEPETPIYLHRRPYAKGRHRGEGFGVRVGSWKYITTLRSRELFQLGRDPGETVNLIDQEPERARALAARLEGWQRAHLVDTAPAAPIDEGDRAALEALGYAE